MTSVRDGATDLYRFYDADDRLLYVGISFSAIQRAMSHRAEKSWWTDVARMEVEHLESRSEALDAETQAIRLEAPLHNVTHNSGTIRTYGAGVVVKMPSPKTWNPWACMYCGRGCGKKVEDAFIQTDQDEFWWILCAECDDNPTPRYWIDASRIADTEAITRWTLHLAEKSWFNWPRWHSMIESHSNILAAKEHAYCAYEEYRERWAARR